MRESPRGFMRSGSPAAAGAATLPSQLQRQAAKHHLRQTEKNVLTEMICSATPMDGAGQPLAASPIAPQPSLQAGASGSESATWRLLIFDDIGRDIIAPLLKVGSLRELGVTLYMHIRTDRDPVPGAPAVYVCAPTEENITRIAKDCGAQLYEWVYVNFTAQVPREALESLAAQLVATQLSSIRHIKIYDRTLSYVALDNDLFSLMLPRSFLTLNRRTASDVEVERHLNAMVLGVSHVLLSLNTLPVIAHSRTGPAEEMARRLAVRLSDAVKERQLNPASTSYLGRPLLLLVDRASDLATALHHPFTYRGLLVDEAGMRLNKCNVHSASDGKDEIVELDPDRDQFYAENASLEFGAVGARLDAALKQYKEEYASLAAESTGGGAGDDDGDGGANAVSRMLANAPLLAERKRYLDAHTKLAYSFLSSIRAKQLDSFHGVELGVLRRSGLDKEEFKKLLSNKLGSLADRQRLYLIAYLMCGTDGDEEVFVQRMLSYLQSESSPAAGERASAAAPTEAAGAAPASKSTDDSFPALQYLKHLRSWSLGASSPNSPRPPNAAAGQGSNGVFGWGGFAQQLAKNIANTLGANVETELPLTKLVDALLQDGVNGGGPGGNSGPALSGASVPSGTANTNAVRAKLLETVTGFDPHTRKPVSLSETSFAQAIVFAIGGGSIAEYDDLKKWESAHPQKAITYGCTAITSGEELLCELSILGSEKA